MFALLTRQTAAALRVLIVLTIVLGIGYPLVVWGVSRIPGLAGNAEGSVLAGLNGQPVGSSLIGVDPVPAEDPLAGSSIGADAAADPYFHTRPSASSENSLGPGDPSTSGGSNRGGFNTNLLDAVNERRALIAAREGVDPSAVPPDAVTASASGVDPHISPAYATLQTSRVARVSGLDPARVSTLVAEHTDGRFLGFLGEPGVNVTELNLAIGSARG